MNKARITVSFDDSPILEAVQDVLARSAELEKAVMNLSSVCRFAEFQVADEKENADR